MKAFINSIETLIQKFGKSAVSEVRFFNMIKDVYNFRDNPNYFDAVKAVYANNAISVIGKSKKKNIKRVIQTQAMLICKNDFSLKKDVVKEVLYSFAIAIKLLSYEEYIAITIENNDSSTKSESLISSIWKSIDKTILFNNALFLCMTIVGIIIFFICRNSGWWPFFSTLIVAISDFIYAAVLIDKLEQKKLTSSQTASICACSSIGIIKTLFLFYFASDNDAFILTYILLILMLLAWCISMIGEEPFSYLKSKNGRAVYCANLTLLSVVIGCILLYPLVLNGVNLLRNSTLCMIRSYKRMDLGFGRYKIGDILKIQDSINNSDSIMLNDCIANDSVNMTIYTYNKKYQGLLLNPRIVGNKN